MTEIDQLRRITLRDLKGFFKFLDKKKREGEASSLRGKSVLGYINFPDVSFTIEAEIGSFLEIESFLFKWKYRGEEIGKRVRVTSLPSNLIKGASCYYFVCPYTHRLCRKLFTDGRVLISRYGFAHTYSQRNYSHRWREDIKTIDFFLFMEDENNFKGRREFYNGKRTRFGRKLAKMAGGEDFDDVYSTQRARIESLLVGGRRGRPPKR